MIYLNRGDVWKYGESTHPDERYSDSFLKETGVRRVDEFWGTQSQVKVMEKIKIYQYYINNGHLPPGNRIFR